MIRTNSPAENWKDHDWPSAPTQRSVRVEPSANRVWISSNSIAAADALNSLAPVARPFLQCPTEGLAKYPLSDRCMRRIRGESITAVSTTQMLSTNPPSRLSQNERHDAGGLRVASHVIVKRWEGILLPSAYELLRTSFQPCSPAQASDQDSSTLYVPPTSSRRYHASTNHWQEA